MRNAFPGCCAAPSARLRRAMVFAARSAADPGSIVHSASPWVPALRSSVKNAAPRPGHGTHCFTRYRDDRFAFEKDEECVPRLLRSAPHFAAWCAADPGPIVHSASTASGTRDDRSTTDVSLAV